ncbi:Pyrethroid hydrolase Ces2a [Bulinus truncatus]|nr:Pyrethroid hydrolase Ces2a [Bulinus truncatus]
MEKIMQLYIVVGVLLLCCFATVRPSPVVHTPFGRLKGQEKTAQNGKTYFAFLGIPYAKPPVGKLRFAKPEAHPALNGVFNATNYGAACIQPEYFLPPEVSLSEDCLFLNVFVKEIKPDARKKILFWIYGGGFLVGSSFGHDLGSLLTDHDIIVVTVNYRLGVLGFLSTEDEAAVGNFGLWDQIVALKWVKDNIAAFGGDPEDVTISGESAGGASASLIALTHEAKSLYSKVICHSGTATSLFGRYVDAKADVLRLAKKFKCLPEEAEGIRDVKKSKAVIECLRTVSAQEVSKDVSFRLYRASFVPRVDGELLPQPPLELLAHDEYLDMIGFYDKPYLISYNNNEQQGTEVLYNIFKSFHYSRENVSTEELDRQWEDIVRLATKLNLADRLGHVDPPEDLVSFVFDWYERRYGRDKALPPLLSDLSFSIPSYDLLNAVTRRKNGMAWSLYFNYYPQFMKGTFKGMIHGMDIVYLLDLSLVDIEKITQSGIKGEFSQEDQELKSLYSDIIAEFIKVGKPEQPLVKGKLIDGWPAYDAHRASYLDFTTHPAVMSYLDRDKRELWERTVPSWVEPNNQDLKHTEL